MVVSRIKIPCFCGGVSSLYSYQRLYFMSSTMVEKCRYVFFCFCFGAEVWIFLNMGGRKLKLGRALKNAERNKQKSLNLVVSIPRKLLHIQVCPVLKLSLCSEVKTIHWSVPWSTSDCVTAPICLCKWSFQFSSVTYTPHVHAFSVTPMGYYLTYTLIWLQLSYTWGYEHLHGFCGDTTC